MLRQRGAGGAGADVGQLAQGVELEVACTGAQRTWSFRRCSDARRRTSATASQSTIRAIWPSESTAAPDSGGAVGDLGRQRAGDELALADQLGDGEGEALVAAAHDDRVVGARGVAGPPKRSEASTIGSTPSERTSIAPAGDRADGLVGEAHGALDAVERDRERAAVGLDDQRGHDRQRQRQADLGARCPGPARRSSATSPPSSRIVGAHRVHADAAAGDVARRSRRSRSRAEKSSSIGARGVDRVDRLGGDQALLGGLARRPAGGSMPRPSSRTVMTTLPPAWRAEISSVPVVGLAGRVALLRRLEAVVERVADEVHERVAERVDDGAVELGVLADELAARPACRAWSRGRGRAAGSAGRRPRPGSSGPA